MSRRIRRHAPLAVNLFPFLAVLICTFGVLILLLVLVVKAADQRVSKQEEQKAAEHQATIDQLNRRLDLQLIRIEGIRQIRPELLKKLRDRKAERAHLMNEIEIVRQQLEALQTMESSLSNQIPTSSLSELKQESAALRKKLADAESLLEQQKLNAVANQATVFSIVPYDGDSGSKRRPIYLECVGNKILLQPFEIQLTSADFIQPMLPNNPLEASLIAVKEYFMKNRLPGSPYPLLIVRPSGADAYAMARHAIKNWDEEFGYELIPEDTVLDFGSTDEQLQKQIELAINAAKSRQAEFKLQRLNSRSLNRSITGEKIGGLTASSQKGGFVVRNTSSTNDNQRPSTNQGMSRANENFAGNSQTKGKKLQAQPDIVTESIQSAGRPIADERGADWALKTKSVGSIGYRRPVQIFIDEDSVVLKPDHRNRFSKSVSLNDGMRSAVEQLIPYVWERMDSWGVAGVNAHWIPELEITANRDRVEQVDQLKLLLQNSGIEVKE